MNQGLTLWEAEEPMVPGVTFKVAARQLEHTLTRDNVIRDAHFEEVLERVQALARGPLGDAVHRALTEAAHQNPLGVAPLFASFGSVVPWRWREDAPLFPTVGGAVLSLAALRPGILDRVRGAEPLACSAPSELADRVAAAGVTVLLGAPTDAHLGFLAARTGRTLVDVATRWRCPLPLARTPQDDALLDAVRTLTDRPVHLARSAEPFLVLQRVAFAPEPHDTVGSEVVLSSGHPLYRKLRKLPPALAAPILVRAVQLHSGRAGPLEPGLVVRALAALESE